jgi:hypothetical protein
MRVRLNLLAALLLSLLIAVPAFASLTGDLQGTVLDPTGAVVPGAKVTIRNKATGVVKTVVSDQNGEFAALQLDLGDYAVTVEKAGLKTIEETASIRSAEKTRIDAAIHGNGQCGSCGSHARRCYGAVERIDKCTDSTRPAQPGP